MRCLLVAAVIACLAPEHGCFKPEFSEPLVNLSIAVGRDATFRCLVYHLGGYRVGWVKADTKAIQAIHDHVITHNPRISVTHSDHSTWNLHIKSVQEEDSGAYMCQINTDPMKSQLGFLDVVVPPDFINEETSSDVMVPEGGTVKLVCRARGYPSPHIVWRREEGAEIVIREINGNKKKTLTHSGEILKLNKVTRSDMGAYLCIASNGVPPTVSKRIMVNVNFHPVIQVPNQLVGAPLGTDVALECFVEASPKSINYWVRDTGTATEMVISSSKYEVATYPKSIFEVRMRVLVRNLRLEDVGSYKCIAKNSLGEVESSIRLYDIPGPTRRVFPSRIDEEDYTDQYGSAEQEPEYDLTIGIKTKPNIVASVPSKSPGSPAGVESLEDDDVISPPSARGTHTSFPENDIAVIPANGPNAAMSIASYIATALTPTLVAQALLRIGAA